MEQRACKPCARAKRRCDKQEPQCARCRRRGIGCIYPPAKQTSFVLCREDDTSTSTFSAHEIVQCSSDPATSENNTFDGSEDLHTLNLGFVTLPVSRSVDKEQLLCYITMMREWLFQWVEQGSNPFIHASLYRTRMPSCIQDAYTTLSCYLHKKPSNEQIIFRILEDRARKLLATEDTVSGQGHVSLNSVEHLARVQALLVYQILGLFDGDIRLRHFAESEMMPVIDHWVQEMVEHVAQVASPGGSVDLCAREQLYEYAGVDQDITNRDNLHWYSWIVAESIQRTWMMASGVHAIYLMMQQDAAPPCLGYMVFTTQPGVWEAPSAVAWSKLGLEMNTGLIQMAEADRLFTEAAPEDVNDFTKVFLEATFGAQRMERWAARARDQG